MNTPRTPNLNQHNQWQPRIRLHLRSEPASTLPNLLTQHPKWTEFVFRFSQRIVTRCPDLRPHFLALLEEIDLVL